jgi:hypothetical protein
VAELNYDLSCFRLEDFGPCHVASDGSLFRIAHLVIHIGFRDGELHAAIKFGGEKLDSILVVIPS